MTVIASNAGRLEERLRRPGMSVIPYLTGGYPDMDRFATVLSQLAAESPAVEVGVPFTDPMADGATIQESSRVALEAGASLYRILDTLQEVRSLPAELVVMSYLNPLLAHGLQDLAERLGAVGVAAVVVPDLPEEETGELVAALDTAGIGLVRMVTPLTATDRLERLGSRSSGFTYAVTMTGTTGGRLGDSEVVGGYLDRVRAASRAPVVAGFGVRSAEQVRALAAHCDGVIVGSALVEVLSSGGDVVEFVRGLQS